MPFDAHANLAYTLVAVAPAPAASGTSLTVSDGSVFPAAPFNATIWPIAEFPFLSNAEIVRVTNVAGNVLTITRMQEGTSARTILVGDQIAATITAKTVTDIETSVPSIAGLISAINVSAGLTSQNLSALTFSNSNGVSFGLTGSVITGTVATNYQSQGAYLTTAALSQDSSKYAGTNGAITGGSITVNTSGVSVNLPAYLTTAMASNRASDFVQATAAFAGTNASGTIASSGISVSVNAGGGDAIRGIAAGGSTASTNTVGFGDANGVSFGFGAGGNSTIITATVKTDYLTTAMQSNAVTLSNIRVSAGTTSNLLSRLTFADGNGVSFGLDASTITATVKTDYLTSQSTQFLALTLGGNTLGTSTFHASNNATLFFHGGNNITLSGNGSSVTISGPNIGGAQTGISGIVVSDATYTSGTVSFSNQANITIGSSVDGATQYIRLSGNPAQTTQSAIKGFGVSNTGQTAGDTGISSGIDWVVAGSQSITLSQSTAVGGPNTVWFQHPAWLTTAMQSNAATLSNIRVSAGTTSNLLSRLTFADSNGVSFGIDASTITATVKTDYLTTAMASNRGSDFVAATAAFNGTNASGTIASDAISVSVNAQTNQTVGLYASSNTYLTSSGTVDARSLSFRGDKSITVGVSNGEVAFSVGAYITTAMASNRGSDFVAATAAFNGTNASGTIASNAISVSVAAPVPIATAVNAVASANSTGTITRYAPEDHRHAGIGAVGISTSGNTAGTTGSVQGTYWFQGGNSLTISQITSNNGSHTLVLSVGNYLTTAMASNRGSDFVQATAAFNGTNASGTIASDAISVSVAAPVAIATAVNPVASANSTGTVTRYAPEDHRHAGVGGIGISTSGNTAGTTGSQVGTYWLQGGNSITVSQITSNNGSHTLVISAGNYITTARASTDAIGLNTAQTNVTWTVNSSGLSLNAGGYAGTGFTTATTAGVAIVGTQNTAGLSLGVPAMLTTAALSGDTSKYIQAWELTGNTAGTTSSLQGTKIYFEGGNSITVSGNSNTVKFSVGNYLTTAMASNRGSDFVQAAAVFNGTNASGTIASGAISVSVAAPIPIATAVKAVASVGSTGTITRYAPEDHQHAGVAAFAVTNTGNTSGNTRSQVGTFYIAGTGALTVSQSTGAAGNDTIWFSGGTAAPSPVNFSAGTMSNNLGSVVFSDSNGLSFGLNGSTITASANTVGTATIGYAVGSANSVGTVTRWVAEDHVHAGIGAVGISTSGNSAGTSGSKQGTYWFEGGNSITLSQITSNNGSHTLVISAGNYLTNAIGAIGVSTEGNEVGTTGSNQGTYWFQGGNNITLSQITSNNGSHTVVISGPSSDYASYVAIAPGALNNTVTTNFAQSTSYMVPFMVPEPLSVGSVRLFEVGTVIASSTQGLVNGSTLSMQGNTSHNFVFYTRGVGANSMSLQYVTSTQVVDKVSLNIQNAAGANSSFVSYSYRFSLGNVSFTKDYSSTAQSYNYHSSQVTDLTGTKMVDYPCGLSLSAGQWFLAYGRSTSQATQNAVISGATRMNISYESQLAISQATLGALGTLGGATNSSVMLATQGLGSFTTGGAATTTASVGLAVISSGVSNQIPYMQLVRIV